MIVNKVKSCFAEFVKLATPKTRKLNGAIKGMVVGFLAMLVILVATFYAAWLYLFSMGKAVLGDLLALIDRVISPQMVAFITFIATCFVDKNGNNIPDRFEKEEDDKK